MAKYTPRQDRTCRCPWAPRPKPHAMATVSRREERREERAARRRRIAPACRLLPFRLPLRYRAFVPGRRRRCRIFCDYCTCFPQIGVRPSCLHPFRNASKELGNRVRILVVSSLVLGFTALVCSSGTRGRILVVRTSLTKKDEQGYINSKTEVIIGSY